MSSEQEIDVHYLIRELKDSLRGIDKLPKGTRGKYFRSYLNELIRTCVKIPMDLSDDRPPIRWNSDIISDCLLIASRGLDHVIINRILKKHV